MIYIPNPSTELKGQASQQNEYDQVGTTVPPIELVSKEFNHLAAILHVYAWSLIFMKKKILLFFKKKMEILLYFKSFL